MRLPWTAGLLLALTLSACGISSGYVTQKAYDPESTYTYMACAVYDTKTGGCAVWMPEEGVTPECWRLELRNADKTGSVCVDQTTWDRITVGEHYTDPSDEG